MFASNVLESKTTRPACTSIVMSYAAVSRRLCRGATTMSAVVNVKQPLHMGARELVALEFALPAIVALLAEEPTARAAVATPRRQSRTPAP